MGGPLRSGDWIFSVREDSTAVSPDRETVYSFDLEGRPISWYAHDRVFKRSLSSELLGRERVDGKRRRFRVSPGEASKLYRELLDRMARAPLPDPPHELQSRVETILRWTPESLLEEKGRFDGAYRPVSILPPDQYLSVVLQATFGCSWNRCTFCNFYQDRPFVARSVEEFRSHTLAVKALLGRAAGLRKSIFLADGNALVLSNPRLRPILEVARAAFPGKGLNGFVDVFTGERKKAEEWRELRELGLERVCIGLESGHAPLLQWMNKPGGPTEALELVTAIKDAGLGLSTILMCGAGGDRFADAHVEDSLALVAAMPLTEGDIVYLSPFVEADGSAYAERAREAGIRSLDDGEREEQYARLRDGVRRRHSSVRVSLYDIREFVY